VLRPKGLPSGNGGSDFEHASGTTACSAATSGLLGSRDDRQLCCRPNDPEIELSLPFLLRVRLIGEDRSWDRSEAGITSSPLDPVDAVRCRNLD